MKAKPKSFKNTPEWEDIIVEYMYDNKMFLPKFVSSQKL